MASSPTIARIPQDPPTPSSPRRSRYSRWPHTVCLQAGLGTSWPRGSRRRSRGCANGSPVWRHRGVRESSPREEDPGPLCLQVRSPKATLYFTFCLRAFVRERAAPEAPSPWLEA